MAVQNIPRPEHDEFRESLVGAAAAVLAARRRDIPGDFLVELFGRAPPEDIERYGPAELAGIAEQSWSFLLQRPPGASKIALVPLTSSPSVAVLDILNDDMPFLVNSVLGELSERGFDLRLVVHPVFTVERDEAGRLTAFKGTRKGEGHRESFIHIHVAGVEDEAQRTEIVSDLEGVLADVRVAVQDWRPMLARASEVAAELKANPPPLPADEIAEAIQFLQWIAADNFTLLGARDYAFTDSEDALKPKFETGLGLLRSPETRLLRRGNQLVTITPEIREFLKEPKLLIMTKAAVRSRVHRRVHLDYIGVKRFDADGKLIGECVLCGLLTSTAYTRSVRAIPYLRRKVDRVISRAGFDPSSHSGKALVNVLEHYPRDDLFQIDEDTLYHFALAIMQLDERPRVRVLPRPDRFDRFVSVLVYIPRDRYDSTIRAKIGTYLATAFNGRVRAFYPFFPEGAMVRVHFIIGRYEGETPHIDRAVLDRAVEAIVRSWTDGLSGALLAAHHGREGRALFTRYRDAFPVDYREVYPPAMAVGDIAVVEALTAEHPLGVELYRDASAASASAGLKVLSRNRPIPLSERVPVLENMGFRVVDERTYHIQPLERADAWFHDMTLESALGRPLDLAVLKERLESCFLAVMGGRAENDGYNALVLAAGLVWRDVAVIRTLSRFLRQVRVPYSQDYMWATLRKHAGIAAQIVTLFHTRFDPKLGAPARRTRRPRSLHHFLDRNRAPGGRQPRRGPHPSPLRQRGGIRDPHQFLSARRRRAAEGSDRGEVLKPQARRHPGAAPALRDLRLFAARRRCASALRQGGARRHPLVGPAAGFPHRNPRPGQSPERQECGDRAGRRQGRLRAEAAAGRRRPRGHPGRRHRGLQALHLDLARHHRQYRHRHHRRRAAGRRRAP